MKDYKSSSWNSKVRFQVKYCCHVQYVSPHGINGDLSDKYCSSVPPPSPSLPLPLLGCSSPPNSHIQNKVIPGCIGIEMLFSLQVFSSFRCLFVVRFEWDIVLSSSYDIRKAWIHHVMSWEGTSTLLNCDWFYLKLGWIQETYPEFLVLKVEVAWS